MMGLFIHQKISKETKNKGIGSGKKDSKKMRELKKETERKRIL
jgi:hypothetical protein